MSEPLSDARRSLLGSLLEDAAFLSSLYMTKGMAGGDMGFALATGGDLRVT
jgi:hypothetical protein